MQQRVLYRNLLGLDVVRVLALFGLSTLSRVLNQKKVEEVNRANRIYTNECIDLYA